MTRNRKYISILDQIIWYFKVYRPLHKKGLMNYHFLYRNGEPVGYGLRRIDGDKEWISGGLLPEYRGQGWGELLFLCLTNLCEKTPYLEVLKSNKKAINLYRKLGYKTVKSTKRILTMKHD